MNLFKNPIKDLEQELEVLGIEGAALTVKVDYLTQVEDATDQDRMLLRTLELRLLEITTEATIKSAKLEALQHERYVKSGQKARDDQARKDAQERAEADEEAKKAREAEAARVKAHQEAEAERREIYLQKVRKEQERHDDLTQQIATAQREGNKPLVRNLQIQRDGRAPTSPVFAWVLTAVIIIAFVMTAAT